MPAPREETHAWYYKSGQGRMVGELECSEQGGGESIVAFCQKDTGSNCLLNYISPRPGLVQPSDLIREVPWCSGMAYAETYSWSKCREFSVSGVLSHK